MKTAKILGYLVGGVIAVMALAVLAAWLFVNPNQYRDPIARAVRDATGRELLLRGDITLSVFPWVSLQLGPASLGNPPGFTGEPFVSLQRASVRARLLPLLHERLEIARVEIDGLDVRLQRNAAGRGNWEAPEGPQDRAESASRTPPATSASNPLRGLGGIKITNASLRYGQFVVQHVQLETASLHDGVVPMSLHVDADRGVPGESATIEIQVDFSTVGPARYRLAALGVVAQTSLAGNSRPIRWNLATPGVDVDLTAQTLAIPAFALTVAGAHLTGAVHGTLLLDDPHLSGALALAPVVLREFVPRWGLSTPQIRDPRAFAAVSGSARFAYGGDALRVEDLRVTFDDTHLLGSMAVEKLAAPTVTFGLTVDRIDLNRYLPPEGQAAGDAGGVAGRAPHRDAGPGAASADSGGAAGPPWVVNGTLAVGSLQVAQLDMSRLQLTLASKDGVSRIFPLLAEVDGGAYSGDITLDRRRAVPSLDEHLSGVDMARLLAAKDQRVHLVGRGTVSMQASGSGDSADALLKSLNGHVDANVAQGAVQGIDLGYELGRAEALLRRDEVSAQDTGRTAFDAFKMSADITDGVAQSKDLTLSSPVLRVTGQGRANLINKDIDFHLTADMLRTIQGLPLQIPVSVTGTTTDPVVRPDIAALAKGQLRQKLKDVLQDKLHGLFGKP